jgi:hypothetical protein
VPVSGTPVSGTPVGGTPVGDVLVRGTDEPARRPVRRGLVGLAVVLALLAGTGDRWQADREREQLLASVTAGERVVDASQSSIASLAEYSAGLLYAEEVSAAARGSAYGNLAEDAGRWQPRLERARSAVATTPVLPWHREVRRARRAYEQRLTAWTDLLTDFAASPQRGFGDRDGTVTASRRAARDALLAAGLDEREVSRLLGPA